MLAIADSLWLLIEGLSRTCNKRGRCCMHSARVEAPGHPLAALVIARKCCAHSPHTCMLLQESTAPTCM